MREILFRGKRLTTGEWMEGYLFSTVSRTYIAYTHQYDDDLFILPQNVFTAVDPSTVSQYTGLMDKNGKRIFEGDIVVKRTNQGMKNLVVSFGNGMFHCEYSGGSLNVVRRYTLNDCLIKVIGNVYDNPELLEDGSNGYNPNGEASKCGCVEFG